jgi:hypothetical protein
MVLARQRAENLKSWLTQNYDSFKIHEDQIMVLTNAGWKQNSEHSKKDNEKCNSTEEKAKDRIVEIWLMLNG